uniref:Heat shock protein 70 n=1 Tax=Alexandrium catenella TaxID=2925 RepID=A0A7S1RUS1_ALECA
MMQKLIERNSTIPTNKSQDFTTAEDYQDYVDIQVYEGERTQVKDNNYLGKFTLKGLPKTLRGVPKIKVTFKIDTNGILEVIAEDTMSKTKSTIQITNEKGRLSQTQIEKMLEEAEKYKGEDEISKGDLVAKENLKVYMGRVRQGLADIDPSKISQKDRDRLEAKLSETEQFVGSIASAKSGKEDFEAMQKQLESAMATIMLKINRQNDDIWDQQLVMHEGEKLIDQGGFFLNCGIDVRELLLDPE